jgi:hypothetical protein
MISSNIEFTADDLAEISQCLAVMGVTEHERSGDRGEGLTRFLLGLADALAAQWLALDDGREASSIEMPALALADVDRDVLEEAGRRLDEMLQHQDEELPNDVCWRFVIGFCRGHVRAELAGRMAEAN